MTEEARQSVKTWNDLRVKLEDGFGSGSSNSVGVAFNGITFTWSKAAISYRIGGGPSTPLCTKVSMVLEELNRLKALTRELGDGKRTRTPVVRLSGHPQAVGATELANDSEESGKRSTPAPGPAVAVKLGDTVLAKPLVIRRGHNKFSVGAKKLRECLAGELGVESKEIGFGSDALVYVARPSKAAEPIISIRIGNSIAKPLESSGTEAMIDEIETVMRGSYDFEVASVTAVADDSSAFTTDEHGVFTAAEEGTLWKSATDATAKKSAKGGGSVQKQPAQTGAPPASCPPPALGTAAVALEGGGGANGSDGDPVTRARAAITAAKTAVNMKRVGELVGLSGVDASNPADPAFIREWGVAMTTAAKEAEAIALPWVTKISALISGIQSDEAAVAEAQQQLELAQQTLQSSRLKLETMLGEEGPDAQPAKKKQRA